MGGGGNVPRYIPAPDEAPHRTSRRHHGFGPHGAQSERPAEQPLPWGEKASPHIPCGRQPVILRQRPCCRLTELRLTGPSSRRRQSGGSEPTPPIGDGRGPLNESQEDAQFLLLSGFPRFGGAECLFLSACSIVPVLDRWSVPRQNPSPSTRLHVPSQPKPRPANRLLLQGPT